MVGYNRGDSGQGTSSSRVGNLSRENREKSRIGFAMSTALTLVPSRWGTILAQATDRGIIRLQFLSTASSICVDESDTTQTTQATRAAEHLQQLKWQLAEFFSSRRRSFDVPLDRRGTVFQRRVWQELGCIPYGETISYRELARAIGHPRAVRAVGQANRCNPILILVPCHRVIAADGTLGGYAAGVEIKRELLALERGR